VNSGHPLVIYGAGGHGRVVLDVALAGGVAVTWVLDDSPEGVSIYGVPLTRPDEFEWRPTSGSWNFLVAVGLNSKRADLYRQMNEWGGSPVNLIHPKAILTERCCLDQGIVAMAGVVVNPGARIGSNVVLNTACSVDHDCVVADHAQLCPGVHLGGNVTVGELAMVGTGASVIPGVRIGSGCTIGAGAVVTRDIPDNSVAVGVPARVVSREQ
jgi:sugar O-acyltransferase (sialic acid O-acetyltransferase NeuD family)